jgi:hypothetical protein
MELLRREELGHFLNEARLLGEGVEVGAEAGAFARQVLSHWQGRSLALVDCWEPQPTTTFLDISNSGAAQQGVNKKKCETLAQSNSRVRLLQAFSPHASSFFEDGSLDWIYLDSNPSFRAVRADLAAWWAKLKPGGLFSGHDFLDAYIPNTGLFGVRSAVAQFAAHVNRAVAWTQYDGPFRTWYFRKQAGPPPLSSRITVLSAYDAGFTACGDIARANHAAYCERNDYRYVCRQEGFDSTRPSPWSKLRFIAEELNRADWVFWIDADALFMNPLVQLPSLLDDTVDLIVSRTGSFVPELNTGAFFVRSSVWSRHFLQHWYKQTAFLNHPWWENAALIHLHDLPNGPRYLPDRVPQRLGDPDIRRHVAVVPHRLFNGMPHLEQVPAGDFVAHFAGLPGSIEIRATVLTDWAARVEW